MKKNILIIGPYLPGKSYGGPVKSLLNITETLNENYNFFIIAPDRDLNSSLPYQNVEIGKWNTIGKAHVFYMPKNRLLKHIKQIFKDNKYDLIYLNSFFSTDSVLIQILKLLWIKNPVLLAPRGEFSPGALKIKSLKKRVYLFLYKIFKMQKNVVYTSNIEKDRKFIKEILGEKVKVITANNILVKNNDKQLEKLLKQKGKLNIVTVSRIVQIKNLAYSLNVLKTLDENFTFDSIVFDIYGPIEDIAYWEKCKMIISELSDRIEVNYKGSLEYEEVVKVISPYHLFLLPTQGENFGHIIQEAFLAGCPVVISDQTPWLKLKEKNVGYDLPLEKSEHFIKALKKFINMNQNEYQNISENAYAYGQYQIEHQDAIKDHIKMFEQVIAME